MTPFFAYATTTRGVTVRVQPSYLPDQSDPDQDRYVWAYHIRIENAGQAEVQLLRRHWLITDADGRLHEVEGPGVVGDQPVIAPGGSYDYVSGCPLTTSSGMMRGEYAMIDVDGRPFEVEIPAFSLDSPHARARPN